MRMFKDELIKKRQERGYSEEYYIVLHQLFEEMWLEYVNINSLINYDAMNNERLKAKNYIEKALKNVFEMATYKAPEKQKIRWKEFCKCTEPRFVKFYERGETICVNCNKPMK